MKNTHKNKLTPEQYKRRYGHKKSLKKQEAILKMSRDYSADRLQKFSKRFSEGRLNREESQIFEKIKKAYETLPKSLKKYESNKTARINQMLHQIVASGTLGKYKPKMAFRQALSSERETTGYGTKKLLYNEFRTGMFSNVYNAYNTYVYRLGFSSAKYYYDNVELTQSGSVIEATLKLPPKSSGIIYNILYLEYNFSGDIGLIKAYMQ